MFLNKQFVLLFFLNLPLLNPPKKREVFAPFYKSHSSFFFGVYFYKITHKKIKKKKNSITLFLLSKRMEKINKICFYTSILLSSFFFETNTLFFSSFIYVLLCEKTETIEEIQKYQNKVKKIERNRLFEKNKLEREN